MTKYKAQYTNGFESVIWILACIATFGIAYVLKIMIKKAVFEANSMLQE